MDAAGAQSAAAIQVVADRAIWARCRLLESVQPRLHHRGGRARRPNRSGDSFGASCAHQFFFQKSPTSLTPGLTQRDPVRAVCCRPAGCTKKLKPPCGQGHAVVGVVLHSASYIQGDCITESAKIHSHAHALANACERIHTWVNRKKSRPKFTLATPTTLHGAADRLCFTAVVLRLSATKSTLAFLRAISATCGFTMCRATPSGWTCNHFGKTCACMETLRAVRVRGCTLLECTSSA
jgi:hypothetical protein